MPLVSSLASLVAAMRSRVLDRGACGQLADRRVDAAARRERCWPSLLAAAPMWRNLWVSSMITKAAAGWSWGVGIKNLSFVMCVAQPSSLAVLVLVGEVRVQAGLLTIHMLLHKASCCT